MNLLSKEELQSLFNFSNKLCVSIYMPVEKAGTETRQNPIRFKNLLAEAESKLIDAGLSTPEAEEFLQAAKALIDNYDFWQHQEAGLACFISKNEMHYYCLPHNFSQLVEVSNRFHLKPLLPLITGDNKFYLLALSQNKIRLFQGNSYSIQELDLPEDVPASLSEALRYDDPEKQLQYHTVKSEGSSIYHAQGVGNTDNKNEILRYFQQVDRGLKSFLHEEQVPLILVGVEYLLPIYQEANSYPHLYSEGVTGNPENVSPKELHQQAWQVIKPHFQTAKQEAISQYKELLATNQSSSDIKQIVPAAYHGQIDTLFITQDLQHWGNFDPESHSIQLANNSSKENFDLLDFAAIHTFLQGGMVYLMPTEKMPHGNSIAAIFRYPVYEEAKTVAV